MNRAILPINFVSAEDDRVAPILIKSIEQSLKARFSLEYLGIVAAATTPDSATFSKTQVKTAAAENRQPLLWRLNGCIQVDDMDKYYARNETYFSCAIPDDPTEFLSIVREEALPAFRQSSNEISAQDLHRLVKTIAEVLADDRHFRHVKRIFSAVYINGDYCNICKFLAENTHTRRVLLLNFDRAKDFPLLQERERLLLAPKGAERKTLLSRLLGRNR